MQSTMELGKAPFASIQSARSGSVSRASPRHHLPQDRAIAAQVVARQARERPMPRRPAKAQRRDHRAEGGAGAVGIGGVVDHVGMGGIEAALRVEVIAALGHGQGDDADRGIGHGGDEGALSAAMGR
jgi:hypothetical protein